MNLPNQTESSDQISPHEMVLQMTMGLGVSRCIFAAARLGIADMLRDGPKHCDDLAAATGTHKDSLYRLLRALAGIGIFSETEFKCFDLTPMASCLQDNVPGSLREFIMLRGEEEYACWGELIHSLETGESAFEHVHGMSRFQYLRKNTAAAERYNRAMAGIGTARNNDAVVAACDFSSVRTLVGVGAGQASLLAAILRRYPEMESIVFENSDTIEASRDLLNREGVADRCKLMSGNFFESVPRGGDAYLLGMIHVLDDQKAVRVLQNCCRSMSGKGRLLVVERLISQENTRWRIKFADLNMLVMSSGRIRTEHEFRELFESAGFRLAKILPTKSVVSVIEGVVSTDDKTI